MSSSDLPEPCHVPQGLGRSCCRPRRRSPRRRPFSRRPGRLQRQVLNSVSLRYVESMCSICIVTQLHKGRYDPLPTRQPALQGRTSSASRPLAPARRLPSGCRRWRTPARSWRRAWPTVSSPTAKPCQSLLWKDHDCMHRQMRAAHAVCVACLAAPDTPLQPCHTHSALPKPSCPEDTLYSNRTQAPRRRC